MTDAAAPADVEAVWQDAALAAALCAIDPAGLGGVRVRARPGPVRDRWLEQLEGWLPPGTPFRRLPVSISLDRLLGGLNLTATLQTGRPVAERGLLAESDGGLVVQGMAERLSPGVAAMLAHVLDTGEAVIERDGIAERAPARIGVIALDEGDEDDERPPAALTERLAFTVDLGPIPVGALAIPLPDAEAIAAARGRLARVTVDEAIVEQLCAASLALGVDSLRAPVLAERAARAAAALTGAPTVGADEAQLAVRLVLLPRATTLPAPPESESEAPPPEQETPPEQPPEQPDDVPADPPPDPPPTQPATADTPDTRDDTPATPDEPTADQVLDAAAAVLPAGLLAQLRAGPSRGGASTPGRTGPLGGGGQRGRAAGVRRGLPRAGARLNVIETLRAAAPWQRLRREQVPQGVAATARIHVRAEDFRTTRYKRRIGTTTIFAVDASGSQAMNRLAEAKGAVELLLAECYVRRDRVALVSFRGAGAEVLLPPTRSLVRARRQLAAVPGGGGTPLAAGLDTARELAESVERQGGRAVIVLLTDGRANVDANGVGGRDQATADALTAARALRATGLRALLIDTAARPRDPARVLAGSMGATYLPMPRGGATQISDAVRATTADVPRAG